MTKFKTNYNLPEVIENDHSEKNHGIPSITLPDQSMSVREIMDRYARGLPIEGAKVPIYDEDNDLPDLKNMDLAEREQMMEYAKNEVEEFKQKHTKKAKDPLPQTTLDLPEQKPENPETH